MLEGAIMSELSIAIIGYGRMGRQLRLAAKEEGVAVISAIDPNDADADYKEITAESLKGADVAVDFSSAGSVMENMAKAAALGKHMVIGTTGWYGRIAEAERLAGARNIGVVYGPNFSIGMNLFFRAVDYASYLFNKAPEYDAYIYESHHSGKADAPSGTALELGRILLRNVKGKRRLLTGRLEGRIKKDEIHVVSLRAGSNPGTHTVGFDSEYDCIELSHSSRGRAAYAKGALRAAEWIRDKKGLHTFSELIDEIIR